MDWLLNHILDIIVVLIIIIGIIYGRCKGIIRMIISLVVFILAAAIASFVSSSTYEYVYINFVRPGVISAIEEKTAATITEYDPEIRVKELLYDNGFSDEIINEIDISDYEEKLSAPEISDALNKVFTEYCTKVTESLSGVLPEEIIDSANEYLETNSTAVEDRLKIFNDNKTSASELIEEYIIRPILMKTVKNVIFAVTFAVVFLLCSILSRIVGLIRKISVVREIDSLLGSILGFVYSVAGILVLSFICSIIIDLTGNTTSIINTSMIEQTYFFKYVYKSAFSAISFLLNLN